LADKNALFVGAHYREAPFDRFIRIDAAKNSALFYEKDIAIFRHSSALSVERKLGSLPLHLRPASVYS
jgi:tRNA(Met) C34 N-acetyltransferase TmcA